MSRETHEAEDSPHIRNLFHQKYRGSRYSFGYPACPNVEDQTKLFALFKPEENVGGWGRSISWREKEWVRQTTVTPEPAGTSTSPRAT